MAEPRVSVVTPFYNTAPWLAGCIESVLAQRYSNFEYLLVNNHSTDGSREIAERYARRDERVRLIDNPAFVGQVENYNGALAQIAADSKYVKMAQADDALYPECLQRMVEVAERDARIGIVGGYFVRGAKLAGEGVPHDAWRTTGHDACRLVLRDKIFPFGSPSAVLYRADLVRARQPFYATGRYHEDTEALFEILLEHDFGFVHQICTFLRADNGISARAAAFNPGWLDYLITIERYGPKLLPEEELKSLWNREWNDYLGFLAMLYFKRDRAAFEYHRKGLLTIGREVRPLELWPHALKRVAGLLLNPLSTAQRLLQAQRPRG
jgi:glycosyltransferase involved in cell wall biosynthesis